MREKWFSDNRDLLKWAILTQIAKKKGLFTILQIPYWRPEAFYPHFKFQDESLQVPDKVWKFFRNIHHVKDLGPKIGISINIVAAEFRSDQRDKYLKEIESEIRRLKRPLLLFLDPDTGLQPTDCKPEHTSINEIKKLWPILKSNEWLVLYQHARRTPDWSQSITGQLSSLCNNAPVHLAKSEDVGKDVAFLCVEKQ
ncbi:MAG: hypothetical protein NT140_01510 [Deltaproteobacteria bacterium]|nr:hypothetical protein [Deltaproteobacteria bacterium]